MIPKSGSRFSDKIMLKQQDAESCSSNKTLNRAASSRD
jgi:hypothetical protein